VLKYIVIVYVGFLTSLSFAWGYVLLILALVKMAMVTLR